MDLLQITMKPKSIYWYSNSISDWFVLGVVSHLLMIMWFTARPQISVSLKHISGTQQGCLYIVPFSGIFYPAASSLRNIIQNIPDQYQHRFHEQQVVVVVDCVHLHHLDFTSASEIKEVLKHFSTSGHRIFWLKPNIR